MDSRSRTASDPAPKLPRASPGTKKEGEGREREISASYGGSGESGKHRARVETESECTSLHRHPISESIHTPSAGGAESAMMSSSLQMTSSRNLLERMGSLESRSPFLTRRVREHGVESGEDERGKVRGREGVRKGDNSDDVVAKGVRSGRGKKRRKRRDGGSDVGSLDHKTSHMTQHESHVTTHEPESAIIGMESGHDSSGLQDDNDDRTRSDSIPSNTLYVGTEECDFEMEPRHAVMGRHPPPPVRGGRGGEGGEGGGLSLQEELALASRDVDGCERERRSPVVRERVGRYGGNPFGNEDTPPPSPTSHPHTLTRHREHTGHTAPPHDTHSLPHTSEHRTSERKTQNDVKAQQNISKLKPLSSLRESDRGRRGRDVSSEYDVITRKEVREICETRSRSNAVVTEERGGGREGERGGGREGERGGGREGERGGGREGERGGGREGEREKRETVGRGRSEGDYDGPPKRPDHITEKDRNSSDIKLVHASYIHVHMHVHVYYICTLDTGHCTYM